jgi:N-methylhydantoinase B
VIEPSPNPGKVSGFPLEFGDRVVMLTAGGGGYGDPLEREPNTVAADVAAGHISEAQARESYGVVLRDGAAASDETAALRQALRAQRRPLAAGRRPATDDERAVVQTFRLHPHTAVAIGLAEDSLVEVAAMEGAPIRGRLHLASDVPEDVLAMAAAAVDMLGVTDGVPLRIEPLPFVAAGGPGAE